MKYLQGRLSDPVTGGAAGSGKDPAIAGSPDVQVNGRPALRVGDRGERWEATHGAARVLVNHRPAFRTGDTATGGGKLLVGSSNVLVGDTCEGHRSAVSPLPFPNGPVLLGDLVAAGATIAPTKASSVFASLPVASAGELEQWAASLLDWTIEVFDIVAKLVKLLLDVVKWAFYGVTSLLYWLFTGGWTAATMSDCASDQGEPTPIDISPSEAEMNRWKADMKSIDDAGLGTDVTNFVHPILERFRPEIYQDPDDIYPVSIEDLLAHSRVRLHNMQSGFASPEEGRYDVSKYDALLFPKEHPYGGRQEGVYFLDIDDEYAQARGGAAQGVVYARAIKRADNEIALHYMMVRPGSYLPYEPSPYMFFEHEGDGESCTILVRRDPGDATQWTLAGALFHGHGDAATCCGRCIQRNTTGRPQVYVAKGSHALAPTAERRRSAITLDSFDGESPLDYDLRIPTYSDGEDGAVHRIVFTKRAKWGNSHLADPDSPLIFTKTYPGYDEIKMSTEDLPQESFKDEDESRGNQNTCDCSASFFKGD